MKRIISFALVLMMLVSILPATFAAEASGVRIVYDVRGVMRTLQMPSLGAAVQMTAIDYEKTSGFFKWIPGGTGHYAGPTSGVFTYKQIADGTQCFGMASNATLSLEINVPKAGVYDFEMYNCVESTPQLEGKAINIYLSHDGITTADADKIGSYTCYDATVEKLTRVSTPNVFEDIVIPEAGRYTVTFTTTSAKWYYNNVGTFVLNGGDSLVPMIDKISCDKEEILVGETAQISASAALMSDYATAADGVVYTYASSDEKIAKVSDGGVVTGAGMGTATITATATKDGFSSSASVDIKVNSENASGVTAVYDMIKGARDTAFPWNKEESFLRNIDYAATKGFWRYHSTGSEEHLAYHKINHAYGIYLTGTSDYIAIAINVPKSGDYIVKLTHGISSGGSKQGAMWILPGDTKDIASALTVENAALYDINYFHSDSALALNTRDAGVHYFEKGENIIVYKVIASGSTAMYPGKIELIGGEGDAYTGVVTVDKTELAPGETASASASLYTSDDWETLSDYTFVSSAPNIAEVSSDGTITAKANGSAYIYATSTARADGNIVGRYITVKAPEEKASSDVAFAALTNVDGYNVSVTGASYNGAIDSIARGTKLTITAPEIENYTFVGWKRGSNLNGKFINQSESFDMTLLTNTYLTAVYRNNSDDGEKVIEYYNENGDYIAIKNADEEAPAVPALAGYSFTGKWFTAEDKELDLSAISASITRAVAKHDAKSVSGSVIVDGTARGENKFNTAITLTATKPGFTAWKRDGKIVSYDREYTYYIWDATEIEQSTDTLSDGARLPIVILDADRVDGSVMIEYDEGDYDIVEAGIVFGTNATITSCTSKYTSQRDVAHGQFAVSASGTARGYVIYRDGTDYKVIYTD